MLIANGLALVMYCLRLLATLLWHGSSLNPIDQRDKALRALQMYAIKQIEPP